MHSTSSSALTAYDSRPFFDKVVRYGVQHGIISPERLLLIQEEFAKGIVQIANYFGTAHLRPELELALHRMVNLISLYLEEISRGDLQLAANSLRDKTMLSHSKGGSDMLRRLHAMPDSTLLIDHTASPESQRDFLEEKTAAKRLLLDDYQAEFGQRQDYRDTIDFSHWLAQKLGVTKNEVDDTEALMRTAMLTLLFDRSGTLQAPTRTAFVRLIEVARSAKAAPDEKRLLALIQESPSQFQRIARKAMADFLKNDLPRIRNAATSADKLLHDDSGHAYFVRESVDENVREYERLVAKEWDRVTRGEADDPAVLATTFLFLATGQPPKAAMLLREARDLIRTFRTSGFDSPAVLNFINDHAPVNMREDLGTFWENDLRPEAQEQLADTDPNWPDAHMDRAIDYLRTTCRPLWKRRQR